MTRAAEPAALERPTRMAWVWLAMLIVVTLSASLCNYCIDGLVDPIRKSLRFSDLQMSFILGWAFVGPYALFSLPAGWIVDRGSRRWILIVASLLWGTGAAGCALAHGMPMFSAGRIMVGLGKAALAPALMSILADCFPSRLRARIFGVAMAAMGVGPGIGLTGAGFLLSWVGHWHGLQWDSWRPTVLLCAGPSFVLALLLLVMPEPSRAKAAESEAAAAQGPARPWAPLVVALLAITAIAVSDGALLSWSTVALVRGHAVPPAIAARDAGYVFIFCGAAAPFAAGALADALYRRHGIPGRLSVALVATAALAVLQFFLGVGDTALLLIVMVGAGLAVVTGEVIGAAVLQDLTPDHRRGLAAAAYALCTSAAIGIGTTGVAMAGHAGLAPSITRAMSLTIGPASALALLLLFALWAAIHRTRAAGSGASNPESMGPSAAQSAAAP